MLDMLIGERVVVEVDGPSHFYRETNTRTASSLLKDQLLRAMGFRVKHLPYQEWQQCGTAVKRTMYCSAFWKDVVAASKESTELHPQLPELVDILDLVSSWQVGQGPHPSTALLKGMQSQSSRKKTLPAFYSEDGLEDHEPMEESGSFDISSEQIGSRSADELIAAHNEAETAMVADREQQISSLQRMRMDQTEETAAEDFTKLFPRSKRREPARRVTTSGIFDFDALEEDTDGEDEEPRRSEESGNQKRSEGLRDVTGLQVAPLMIMASCAIIFHETRGNAQSCSKAPNVRPLGKTERCDLGSSWRARCSRLKAFVRI
eukprot:Skav224733  [mRNA]  locus=scaffold699:602030:602986:- [translate_table: standard]